MIGNFIDNLLFVCYSGLQIERRKFMSKKGLFKLDIYEDIKKNTNYKKVMNYAFISMFIFFPIISLIYSTAKMPFILYLFLVVLLVLITLHFLCKRYYQIGFLKLILGGKKTKSKINEVNFLQFKKSLKKYGICKEKDLKIFLEYNNNLLQSKRDFKFYLIAINIFTIIIYPLCLSGLVKFKDFNQMISILLVIFIIMIYGFYIIYVFVSFIDNWRHLTRDDIIMVNEYLYEILLNPKLLKD